MRKSVVLLLLFFVFFSTAFPASAHILQIDGTIGAVLHIIPDDDPVAGQTSTLLFDIKDKTDKFSASDCRCDFTVTQNNKQLISQPLFQNGIADNTTATVTYTFPTIGVYTVTITGKPQTTSFQPFKLSYEIRVARSGTSAAQTVQQQGFWQTHIIHGLAFLLALPIIGFVFYREQKNSTSKKGVKKKH